MENEKDNGKLENEQSQNQEYLNFIKKMSDLGFDDEANMTEEEFKEYNRKMAEQLKELADGMGDLMSSLGDMIKDLADDYCDDDDYDDDDYDDDDDDDIDFDIDEENARCDQLIEDMDEYLASFDDDDDD